MGCDGGVLAMQRKYMRGLGHKINDKIPEEVSKRFRALIRTRCCAISNEQLRDPIVACELGHLYNKEAVLVSLLDRTLNSAFQHIRGTKDLIACRFTLNPNFKESVTLVDGAAETKGVEGVDEDLVPKYICPVTRVELNAKQPFVVVRTTGWVLSERAVREIGEANLQEEYGPFTSDDVIRLAPEEEEEEGLRARMLERRALAKKNKKRKKHEEEGVEDGKPASCKKKSSDGTTPPDNSSGATTGKTTAVVPSSVGGKSIGAAPMGLKVSSLVEEAKRTAQKEMASSSSFASLFSSGENNPTDKSRLMSVRALK